MRFLADESCDFAVIEALRGAGRDVVPVAEISPRADDEIALITGSACTRLLRKERIDKR